MTSETLAQSAKQTNEQDMRFSWHTAAAAWTGAFVLLAAVSFAARVSTHQWVKGTASLRENASESLVNAIEVLQHPGVYVPLFVAAFLGFTAGFYVLMANLFNLRPGDEWFSKVAISFSMALLSVSILVHPASIATPLADLIAKIVGYLT